MESIRPSKVRVSAVHGSYSQISDAIKVTASPVYLPDQSDSNERHFVWAYTIRIENKGKRRVQLIRRSWKIINAYGHVQEVTGPGVVGEQPMLDPKESFEYTSGTHLNTPSGFMSGTYEMEDEDGNRFHVTVPTFALDIPHRNRVLH